jgi:hypothetical protein
MFFDNAEKRQVWFYSLSWFSFLPLFSPGAMLAMVFDLSQYFLTGTAFMRMWSPYMHHRAILAVFLVLGTLDALTVLRNRKVNVFFVSFFMMLVILFLQFYYHLPLNKLSL